MAKEDFFRRLCDAVIDMDEEAAVAAAQDAIDAGVDPYEAIDKGLSAGMARVGQLYEEEEYFIPELLMASDAMYAGLGILRKYLQQDDSVAKDKVVIGVVEGDTHDIGKNIVKIMMETSGYEMIDMGRDVSPRRFVDAAKEHGASIIALATLMTTTMDGMQEVVRILEEEQMRDRFKVMIGGGPVSQSFADRIGADGYAVNAVEAVRLAAQLTGKAV